MKKFLFTALLTVLFISSGFAQKTTKIKLKADANSFEVKASKSTGFTIETSLSNLNLKALSHAKGNFVLPSNDELIKVYNEGMPNIPVISKLIEIPQSANVELKVISYNEQIIKLADYGITDKIMPALRSQSKSEDDVPFVLNEKVYNTDDYFNKEIAVYEESGQLRAVRLGRIEISPIQYNPVKNTLRILNNLVVEISFKDADFSATDALKSKYSSPYFLNDNSNIINNIPKSGKALITNAPVTFVIVSDPLFRDALQPLVEWKTKKGFKVIEAYTDDPNVGTTVASIKSYCKDLYENPPANQNPPSFILVVGDVDRIPATYHSEVENYPYSDLDLAEYTNDYLPEVNFGRWSADNADQVSDIVYKSVRYEKFEMADPSYLGESLLVAGDDEGYEDAHGGGAIWYADNYYLNSDHGINSHTFLQKIIETWPEGNSQAHDSIIVNINNGVALANYTAHCSSGGWVNPSFSQNDLNTYITNTDKFGLWIGNCCQSNQFNVDDAFSELAIRKPNAGVIGYIGGSHYTYWNEDYYWGTGVGNIVEEPSYSSVTEGSYDGIFHDQANEVNDISTWYITNYQSIVCGNLAVESSSSNRKDYYWVIYQLAGDPSIIPFLGVPDAMVVTPFPSVILTGMTSLNVSSAPYAYVALSQDGVLIAAGMSDENGNADLTFAGDTLSVGNADLVVTAQNKQPYIGTIEVRKADKPFVIFNSYTTNISADYGQTVALNVTLENITETDSGLDALNVEATLSLSDEYITIVDGTETYGTITAGSTKSIDNAFSVTIADNIPDQYIFNFDLTIVGQDGASNNYTWPAIFNLTANAPVLTIGSLTIDDSAGNNDGIFDAGETADIIIETTNEGHADINNAIGEILTNSTDIAINSAVTNPISLGVSETNTFVFNVTADEGVVDGTIAEVNYEITGGNSAQYSANHDFDIIIGIMPIYYISDVGPYSVCTGGFYDTGGESVNYQNGEDYTITFLTPNNKEFVRAEFTEFSTETGYDYLYVYDGVDINSTIIGTYDGGSGPGIVEGSNGLTFRFTSDVSNTSTGWEANISCVGSSGLSDEVVKSFKIIPNPNNGIFVIDFGELNTFEASVKIMTLSGQTVYESNSSANIHEIDLRNHSKGIYFIQIKIENNVITDKIILK